MKFQRIPKYGQLEVTARKLRMIENKPKRERKALAAKMPLFAELLPQATQVDVQAVLQQRQQHADAAEQRHRSLYARVWRESRRDFFYANAETQEAIRDAWKHWTGPRTCLYFRYVVDLHTGVMEARSLRFQQELAEVRAQRQAEREAQPHLF